MEKPQPRQRLFIRKQNLKFSAAHMTVFGDGSKERLHGHNYRTGLQVVVAQQKMVPFSFFKSALKELCQGWDERVLLPGRSPFFELQEQSSEETQFLLCKKRYVLPTEDCLILPVENISSEGLALLGLNTLIERWRGLPEWDAILGVQFEVEETDGQGAIQEWVRE